MNRWHVFEYMKSVYMSTGHKPSEAELRQEFASLPDSEITEGVEEFQALIQL